MWGALGLLVFLIGAALFVWVWSEPSDKGTTEALHRAMEGDTVELEDPRSASDGRM